MIKLRFGRRGLASIIDHADKSGFAAPALDGRDVAALIGEERDRKLLTRAIECARAHNEPPWEETCARRLAELDPAGEGRLMLASVLVSHGRLAEAEDLLTDVPAGLRHHDLCLAGLGTLRARQGFADEALACFGRLPGGDNTYYPPAAVLPAAEKMIQGAPLRHACAFMVRLRERYPSHLLIRSLHAQCLAYEGDLERARETLSIPHQELAEAGRYERRRLREAEALILSLAGWNNELFDFARDVLADDPSHWAMYYQASEAAINGARLAEYDEILGKLQSSRPGTPEAAATLCRWMIDKGRTGEAKALIEHLRGQSAESFLGASLYLAVSHGSAEEVACAFDRCMACGIAPLGPIITYVMYMYYFEDRDPGQDKALDLLDRYRSLAENNAAYWQLYLRCLIATSRTDEARTSYLKLPRGLRASARLQPFDMYFNVLDGEDERATKAWARFIAQSRHVCVNGRTSYPETVSLRYGGKPGAVLLFSTVYNGITYLDWFLDHYRALGVDHFFFTDNASDDGTADRLTREPDVSLFSNAGSFAASAFGIVWTNHLLQRFGVGHWCFHVDIDEGFVFPGQDRGRSLQDLVRYLDAKGYGAVAATEVDMYAAEFERSAAADLFSAHRHFDLDYRSLALELPPYRLVRGGVRRRMTGLALTMTKTPLVRVSPDFRYIECNHYTTHLPVADVAAALLHYKFVGDVAHRLKEAIDRGEHFGGALAYRRLRSATDQRGWGETLLSDGSRTYHGASSLEAEGIMESSPAWESFSR